MTELDQFWASEIADALEKAKATGRHDIADYLTLRASNDLLRSASTKWLLRCFIELADELQQQGRRITLETDTKHSFAIGHSTMAGSRISFGFGLRKLTIETGWTRKPEHGFMRGNTLAHARVNHFGFAKANKHLVLIRAGESPQWVVQEDEDLRSPLFDDFFQQHFDLFLDIK